MIKELMYQVLLMLLGAVIPPAVPFVMAKFPPGLLKPRPATVRITAVATVIAVFVSAFFITLYDRGLFPFAKVVTYQRMKYDFTGVHQNTNRGTIVVTVSAVNAVDGFTMYAAVADSADKVVPRTPEVTVAMVSFPKAGHIQTMTFLVPRGSWYSVTTDGGRITPAVWTEFLL